jgi:hypothetical protein
MSEILVNTIKKADGTGSLTVPAETGTVLTSGTPLSSFPSGFANGITEADVWRLTATLTSNGDITANLERADDASSGLIGSGVSQASGIFTFPSTGIYLVINVLYADVQSSDSVSLNTNVSTDGGSTYDTVASSVAGLGADFRANQGVSFALVDVTNTANVKVKFTASSIGSGTQVAGGTDGNATHFTFIRLGDT